MTIDYPDLKLNMGLEVIAGLLYVPLSAGGRDFIAFLRKGQPRQVNWAGRPYKSEESQNVLEPRQSFKIWSEMVAGRCRAWTDEHLETAGVLALVYGKVGVCVDVLSCCGADYMRGITRLVHRGVETEGECAPDDQVDEHFVVERES